ncbi:dimethyl sulfoxide reductase anchor subunit family protein [Fuscibacter oryzae]|uniref:Dimethyl sulfoxide reductase anchor subunit n=1 Tax=Fuscibacter oryzae TaxID=2803939 RepID=A0A8J7MPS2_9RHOB|nr:DmsC/YnfH family molybdoenzyme membrane anchor subunit [Fuscibacter oryzae]MBL4927761.1 dimethyl sulfoxide reductase anchor subunit [Fuscibacter oryzae]
MHPAPSVILFTTLSGLGFGFLAFLGAGCLHPASMTAFLLWGLGYALAVGGLLFSTLHLGNPQRAWRAFSQWRTSWLSREGWASVVTLLLLPPVALSDWLGLGWSRLPGMIGAAMCFVTIFTTSMIYAQLKTIPRWNHWITPVLFLAFSGTGGAILAGKVWLAVGGCVVLAAVLVAGWRIGDGRFETVGATMESATGLGSIGKVRVFERGHTAGNYLLREMIFVVGRKHAARLRVIALALAAVVPALILLVAGPHPVAIALAALCHLIGAMAQRWLFFAEAEHVVGLYYGQR